MLIRALGPGNFYLPLGVMSIYSYLNKHKYKSAIFDRYLDPDINSIKKLVRSMKNLKVIGISAMTIQIPDAKYLCSLLKKITRKKVKIIVGGIHATALPYSFKGYADHVIVGEGEIAFKEFMDNDCKGNYILQRKPVENLDDIPFLSIEELKPLTKKGDFYISTSRGCPYRCNFCLGPSQRVKGIRYRSIEKVVEYINKVAEGLGITSFFIVDDIFVMSPQRVKKFCNLILKLNKKLEFTCFTHAGHGSSELYRLMKKTGFNKISIGIEHGTNELLDYCGKNTSLDKIEETCRQMYRAGIKIGASYILGNIPETNETITKTVEFAKKIHIKYKASSWFSFAQPEPGSRMFEDAQKVGKILEKDFTKWVQDKQVYLPEKVDLNHLIKERKRGQREANKNRFLAYLDSLKDIKKYIIYIKNKKYRKIKNDELERVKKCIKI